MKAVKLYFFLLPAFFIISISSCKKQDAVSVTSEEQETTFQLSNGQAVADNVTEDANSVFMEAAAVKNLLGNNSQTVTTTNCLSGVSVSVTPATGFPKTMIINFGSNSTSANGTIRSGKINILLSDSVRKAGSTAIITFTDYKVNGYIKAGTVTWTNTSTAAAKGWQRKVENGKVTAPDGRYWLHSGVRDAVQIGGANTPNTLLDDIFLITGNHTVTNAAGKTKNCFITEALQKNAACDNIAAGKLRVEGDKQNAIIDFGDGTCDKIATVSINGGAPRTIYLR